MSDGHNERVAGGGEVVEVCFILNCRYCIYAILTKVQILTSSVECGYSVIFDAISGSEMASLTLD